MRALDLSSATGEIARAPGLGQLILYADSVPADETTGYSQSALLLLVGDGGEQLYVNAGTTESSRFIPLSASASFPGGYYDSEIHIGLVAGDATVATATENTTRLNAALAATWAGGDFDFAHGGRGPVLRPIRFAGKTFYFAGVIRTSDRIGGAMYGTGAGGYGMGSDQFTGTGTFGGMKTRIVRIDGENGGPVISLHGSGFELNGIDFYGRQYSANNGVGTKSQSCIRVEGGHSPKYRGLPTINGCGVHEADYGIHCTAGYYDSDETYHADENHADMGYVRGLEAFNVGSVFRSENKQALDWVFDRIALHSLNGTGVPSEIICFDMVKGGAITATGVVCNFPKTVLISVQDSDWDSEYEYGTQSYDIRGLFWDAYPAPDFDSTNTRFTLFRYAGATYNNIANVKKHLVRVSGVFGQYDSSRYDTAKLIDLGATAEPGLIVGLELYADILNMPVTDFARCGAGPWFRWQASYSHWVKIDTGAITVRNQYHSVETEAYAASDDLTAINGGGPGSLLILKAYDTTHTVVVKNGTGNIKLGGSDCTLDNTNDTLTLICDGTNWLEVARSNNGT